MIFIQRPVAPDFLTDENQRWRKEIISAIAHYEGGSKKPFTFQHYNDKKVKDELRKIFAKCAYCESPYGAVYDGDVEHFRPKGRIKEKNPQTPGYYWLANEWTNLYLACQHCNQRRRHILYGETTEEGYGKLDQFPLDSEESRLSVGDSGFEKFKKEERARLLIDPCADNPKEHLKYEETEAVILPMTDRGRTSISVYVLRRPLLVRERKAVMLKLFGQIKCVSRELSRLNRDPDDQEQRVYFEEEFERLLDFGKKDAPYAGMCLYFIDQFLKDNDIK
ncbi:HNH endonuclease [Flavobacterium sp. P21]|uniref:HNH endonuclease n=1 Tax=Flavobacterium sp. P21 TaxID=3423948 RepID=UPI003D67490F